MSGKKEIRFWAKGDGQNYALAVITQKRSGRSGEMPAIATFVAGPEWKLYSFPFSTFQTDGGDIMSLAFARAQSPGKFTFELDQLEIK